MRIIHCADLHLDSKLEGNFSKEQARERRGEILNTFVKMVDYAEENEVEAIIISGDLFDKNNISSTASNAVKNVFLKHPNIRFYYLKGNHDSDGFLDESEGLITNLYRFYSEWGSYEEAEGKIMIYGIEIDRENSGRLYNELITDNDRFNIVILHGQESGGEKNSKDKTEIVNLRALKNKGIDYLALGHIHQYRLEKLDARGIFCYPGCLEGRGFDECGEKGFVLLDIDPETGTLVQCDFVPFAKRRLFTVETDISGCENSAEVINAIEDELKSMGVLSSDLIKIVYKGGVTIESERDDGYILSVFKDRYYFVKIVDETKPKVSLEDYLHDMSLKGEFVRTVMADEGIAEDEKPFVIKYGLDAIMGIKS